MAGSSLILPGRSNAAQYFNGTSSFGSTAAALSLSSWSQLSISFWLNWTAYSALDNLAMEYGPTAVGTNFSFNVSPNGAGGNFRIRLKTTNTAVSDFTRPGAGVWHHYLVLFDLSVTGVNQIPAVYVDGMSVSLSRIAFTNNTGNWSDQTLWLMSRIGTGSFGQGGMAQLSLFAGTLLGADDAKALAGGADPRSISTGATHFWRMDRKGAEPNSAGSAPPPGR